MTASPRRRAFGQHFLKDPRIIARIVAATFEAAERAGARGLLEIGPGRGALTRPLLEGIDRNAALERFLIVEKDRRLAEEWTDAARTRPNVEVISGDFLEVPPETVYARAPLVVVSNLPYSSGTAILQSLARAPDRIPAMVLMFQAEVAARLRASPGEKAWGSLSLWTQNRWEVTRLLAVPPGAFAPPPDVNSEVVLLEARPGPRVPPPDGSNEAERARWEARWEKLIRIPFLHRRKMLRSGLPKDSEWKAALERAGIDGARRAEELGWDDWAAWMAALDVEADRA